MSSIAMGCAPSDQAGVRMPLCREHACPESPAMPNLYHEGRIDASIAAEAIRVSGNFTPKANEMGVHRPNLALC
ncbi:hypothetical protein [Sphingomonas elodea]|uniref:hypothetical protein n=1 Tax=Sphingomonas elodea TaxID=179878 RepID=UPI001300C80E|nr:hypothetical protein [Sphingomonas elodea]